MGVRGTGSPGLVQVVEGKDVGVELHGQLAEEGRSLNG